MKAQFEIIKGNIRQIYPNTSSVEHSGVCAKVLILFPELTVRNERNQKHTIYDMVVEFDLYKTYVHSLVGYRLSLSPEEVRTGYSHSHLPGYTSRNSPQNFCTGQSLLRELLELRLPQNYLEADDCGTLLFTIEKFLEWESIDGRPYRNLADIHQRNNSGNLFANPGVSSTTASSYILESIFKLKFR